MFMLISLSFLKQITIHIEKKKERKNVLSPNTNAWVLLGNDMSI
jgi:hypothetical protein